MIGLVLSTGRCGTQWLTAGLREFHPQVQAEHEPIGPLYAPRRHFRQYEEPAAILGEPAVADHVEALQRGERPYIETGWPLFAALPLLAERLGERLRVVHLTRHPVPTALSHLAHSSYAGSPREDAYTRLATLGPGDPRVFQPEYAELWPSLTAYERCLFWWTEVGAFGLEFARRFPRVPLLRVAAEPMLAGDEGTLRRLLQFLELRWDRRWLAHARRLVDRWHHHTDRDLDPLAVKRHRLTMRVAAELGYDVEGLDVDGLEARYRGTPDPGLDRIGRSASGSACHAALLSSRR